MHQRMPFSYSSRLIALPREFIANFEAQYAAPARSEIVRLPEIEVTLMIRPSPCARMTGRAAWTTWNVPWRLVSYGTEQSVK